MVPCVYFSWKLTPAETNYDMGNKELLSINAAFEEWRHLHRGGTTHIPGYHWLQEYFWSAKRLNPGQVDGHAPSPNKQFISQVLWQRTLHMVHNSPRSGQETADQNSSTECLLVAHLDVWHHRLYKSFPGVYYSCPNVPGLTSPLTSSLIYPTHKVIQQS